MNELAMLRIQAILPTTNQAAYLVGVAKKCQCLEEGKATQYNQERRILHRVRMQDKRVLSVPYRVRNPLPTGDKVRQVPKKSRYSQ